MRSAYVPCTAAAAAAAMASVTTSPMAAVNTGPLPSALSVVALPPADAA